MNSGDAKIGAKILHVVCATWEVLRLSMFSRDKGWARALSTNWSAGSSCSFSQCSSSWASPTGKLWRRSRNCKKTNPFTSTMSLACQNPFPFCLVFSQWPLIAEQMSYYYDFSLSCREIFDSLKTSTFANLLTTHLLHHLLFNKVILLTNEKPAVWHPDQSEAAIAGVWMLSAVTARLNFLCFFSTRHFLRMNNSAEIDRQKGVILLLD